MLPSIKKEEKKLPSPQGLPKLLIDEPTLETIEEPKVDEEDTHVVDLVDLEIPEEETLLEEIEIEEEAPVVADIEHNRVPVKKSTHKPKKGKQRKVKDDEDKFVDKKNKRITPIGGKRSRSVRADDFDDRSNKLKTTNVVALIVVVALILLFAIGLKNTFAPANNFSRSEIQNIARNGVGATGFPRERGQSFAESFIEDILTLDSSSAAYTERMSYYYKTMSAVPNIQAGEGVKQNVIITPKTFEYRAVDKHSSMYKISTYVSNVAGDSVVDGSASGRWLSFSVNVYYDSKSDAMAIEPSSPSIIPGVPIASPLDVPSAAVLGNGKVLPDMDPILTPTINGYIQAYSQSSIASHESILQYIPANPDIELYNGFGGSMKLSGTPEQSIQKLVYGSDVPGEYKVDTTVEWVDSASSGKSTVTYKSRYILTINRTDDNRYIVQSFRPYVYQRGS